MAKTRIIRYNEMNLYFCHGRLSSNNLWICIMLAVCPLLVTDCWVTELATWAEPTEPCVRRGNELSEIGR